MFHDGGAQRWVERCGSRPSCDEEAPGARVFQFESHLKDRLRTRMRGRMSVLVCSRGLGLLEVGR